MRLSAHSPLGRRRRRDALAQLAGQLVQRAQPGADAQDRLRLAEHRARDAGLAQREMDARELEPGLDRQPGQAVVEQRPEPVDRGDELARLDQVAHMDRDPGRGDDRRPARQVVGRGRPARRWPGPAPRRSPPDPTRPPPSPAARGWRSRRWPRRVRRPRPPARWRAPGPAGRARRRRGARSATPTPSCATGRHQPSGPSPSSASSQSASIRSIPSAAGVAAQRGDPRLDRRAAVGQHGRRGAALRRALPARALGGASREDVHPGADHGDRGVARAQLVVVPVEPGLERGDAAGEVGRQRELLEEPGDVVGQPGAVGVVQRRLELSVGLAPGHRPAVELAGRCRARGPGARGTAGRGTGGGTGTTSGGDRAGPGSGSIAPATRARSRSRSAPGRRRTGRRTSARAPRCASGTAPPPPSGARAARAAGSRPRSGRRR